MERNTGIRPLIAFSLLITMTISGITYLSGNVFGYGEMVDDIIKIVVLILSFYSAFSFIPSVLIFGIGNKMNIGIEGKFGWTYLGSWTGGIFFMLLFAFWSDYIPFLRIFPTEVAFMTWGLVGTVLGGIMGFAYLGKSVPIEESTEDEEESEDDDFEIKIEPEIESENGESKPTRKKPNRKTSKK